MEDKVYGHPILKKRNQYFCVISIREYSVVFIVNVFSIFLRDLSVVMLLA